MNDDSLNQRRAGRESVAKIPLNVLLDSGVAV